MPLPSLNDLLALLREYGNAVVAVVIALESIGLPLPGETLLIAAAVLAATTQQLDIGPVVLSAALGAIAGQTAGYAIGAGIGFRLLRRYGGRIGLTDRRLAYGRALFRRHGGKVVFVARFLALLRTMAALLAGANRMPWTRFMLANVTGSLAWSALYGFGAYLLGHAAHRVAGPVAIGIGLTAIVAVLLMALYAHRHEQHLLAGSAPTRSELK